MLPPEAGDLIRERGASEWASPEGSKFEEPWLDGRFLDNVLHSWRLGLGVLAASFAARHAGAVEGSMSEMLSDRELTAPEMEQAATRAVRELMANPSSPDVLRHPRVAAATRELAVAHARLCDTVQRLQRQVMRLPAPLTAVPTSRRDVVQPS